MTDLFGTAASREVIGILEQAGYEAVFVGGAVRDYVLGKPATDIDIATSAEPEEVKSVFPMTVDLGTEHGTVLVLMDGEPIEVTTYRTEGTYTDHRRPDSVQFVKSLREDLLRRDFTMNALAMTKDGELIDLFEGRQDMTRRLIRAVGNAADRFHEDALRMFRAIRFAAVLDFAIEQRTFQAICENAEQIRHVSVERLKVEMDKLFNGVNPAQAFWYIQDSGLSLHLPLFPKKLEQLSEAAPFDSPLEGWACLMLVGDFTPLEITSAYKLSNVEKSFLISVKNAVIQRAQQTFTVDDYYMFDVDILITAEKLVHVLYGASDQLSKSEIVARKQALPIQSIGDLAVNGTALISWAGIRGGKWTGEWIKKIASAILHGTCENDANNIKEWFLHEFNREK